MGGNFKQISRSEAPVIIERTPLPAQGDYACAIALKLSSLNKLPALEIAKRLAAELEEPLFEIAEVETTESGFLNFRLKKPILQTALKEINSKGDHYGRSEKKLEAPTSTNPEQAEDSALLSSIQYAHVRCCSIIRMAIEPWLDIDAKEERPSPVTKEQWQEWLNVYKHSSDIYADLFHQEANIFSLQKKLIIKLSLFPEEVEKALFDRSRKALLHYAAGLGEDFQNYYESERIITQNTEETRARLGLIVATKQVLANALNILSSNAPDYL